MVKPDLSPKRQRTRQRLIDAALAIIDEEGFAAASLDAIAARAGVTSGAIYSNFASKAELLWEAAGQRSLNLRPELVAGATPAEQARAVARALMTLLPHAKREAAFHRELNHYIQSDPELQRRQSAQYAALFDAIARQLEDAFGDQLAIPPRSLGLAVQALAIGFINQWALTPEEVTEAVVAAAYESLAIGATTPRR